MSKNKKEHGILIGLECEILGESKIFNCSSNLKGYIHLKNLSKRSKIVLPMRSFLQEFLIRFRDISANSVVPRTLRVDSNSASIQYGLKMSLDTTNPNMSMTLGTSLSNASVTHGSNTLIKPFSPSINTINFSLTRTFVNNVAAFNVNSFYLKGKKTVASTGSVVTTGASTDLLAYDKITPFSFPQNDNCVTKFTFEINNTENGGPLMNFARLIYNLLFIGQANPSDTKLLSRSAGGTTSYNLAYGQTASNANKNSYYLLSTSAKLFGIVVGNFNQLGNADYIWDGNETRVTDNINTNNTGSDVVIKTTGLTYGESIISSVSAGSNEAIFTIQRDFTNSGTSVIALDRIGLLTKGNTAESSLTTVQSDSSFICLNKPENNQMFILQPNQILRATYKFRIEC